MHSRAITWWTILRIALAERLAYRGDFALGTLMRFLPIITQIFLWQAIFAARDGEPLKSYTYYDFVAYYLLTMLGRAFSSMPGLASGIASQIRQGEIKKYMIQPVDLIGYMFLTRVAHKLTYYAIAIGPFALVFWLCADYFPPFPEPSRFVAFLLSLAMGFALGYFLETCIGLIGFWFLEVSSLLFVYMLFSFFLSGHMFPLDMLPEWAQLPVQILPLNYLAYFPAAVYLGKIEGNDLLFWLAVEALWIVFFIGLSRFMLHFGYKRYSGYGG